MSSALSYQNNKNYNFKDKLNSIMKNFEIIYCININIKILLSLFCEKWGKYEIDNYILLWLITMFILKDTINFKQF